MQGLNKSWPLLAMNRGFQVPRQDDPTRYSLRMTSPIKDLGKLLQNSTILGTLHRVRCASRAMSRHDEVSLVYGYKKWLIPHRKCW
jgi:hypothetical protein